MNIETAMVRDFFTLNNACWADLSKVILTVKDKERLSSLLFKYLSIHVWTYDTFKRDFYPDGCPVGYYRAINKSSRVFGDINWVQIIDHMRFIKQLETALT